MTLDLALPITIIYPTTYGHKQPTHHVSDLIGAGPFCIAFATCLRHPSPMQGIKRYNDAGTTVTQPV
ncbi:MAG: hypothetical protein EBU08_08425 [Micrococcales bacterium]|nr:hypothetical protein [Micrococcales bacterium]